MVHRGDIILLLKRYGILNDNGTLSIGTNSVLRKHPEVTQQVVEFTSFLRYNASLKVRIQCVMQNITSQPKCNTCGAILHMREDGRFRNTFPTFCSSRCSSVDIDVIEKRQETNLKKYGHTNVLVSESIKQRKKDLSE